MPRVRVFIDFMVVAIDAYRLLLLGEAIQKSIWRLPALPQSLPPKAGRSMRRERLS